MQSGTKALCFLLAAGVSAAQDAAPQPQTVNLPVLLDLLEPVQENAQGDTLLLIAARAACEMPTEARQRLLEPLIVAMLQHGYDPLIENHSGCNAVFYLAGMPEFYQRLTAENLLPRELALRIPHDEAALLRYMRLRNDQALLSRAVGSRDYLTRRYCAPAFDRAERLMRNYLGAHSISQVPPTAMGDILTFMHLANPAKAEAFVNSLPVWEHGEHFLEEIPAHLLKTLHSMGWKVDGKLLRMALHKLGTLLPVSKDDMIECDASLPMSDILRMLTRMEGNGALPELQHYAAAHDPGIVHTALALQMQLKGLPLPWEPAFYNLSNPELVAIRQALQADSCIRRGHMDRLRAADALAAAALLRQHGMPKHAEMMEGIVEGDRIVLRPELRPAYRTRYEEIREDAPHVALLRYLMQHEELLRPQPTGEVQP